MKTRTPCTSRCALNSHNTCVGCGRDISEIVSWNELSEQQKVEVTHLAAQRKNHLIQEQTPVRKVTRDLWLDALHKL